MVEKYSFGIEPLPHHAWNATKQQVAVAPNNQEIRIYQHDKSSNDWAQLDTLNRHDLKVTGVDWAPKTNRIVTCSEDRDAYVWEKGTDGKWTPTQVLLRINRAATCVKWSPQENKFAAGSGARIISICYFEKANNWWVSKHIKKPIKSTVNTIDWHPNNVLLAAGSADFKVKVFSAFIKDIKETCPETAWGSNTNSLGNLLVEFNNSSCFGGWIHCLSFSSDGNRLCWVAHDSSISVADVTQGSPVVFKLRTDTLPFLSCVWVNSTYIVAAGHSCCPLLYAVDANNQIKFVCKLDRSQKKEGSGLSAMRKFQSLDRQAKAENDTSLDTVHQNSIKSMQIYSSSDGTVTKLSTTGLDGQLVIWDLNFQGLESGIQGLKI
ncbi:actin-related protein 2/3 complex subunit 1A-A isoform X1 [Planococcus citri]|uniref:actin-related protein 2/3 complex subunit 1A-A isoform X1 n=1 Tax=Planococcus citri TaxID=170843 RepID=UPI0031F89C58